MNGSGEASIGYIFSLAVRYCIYWKSINPGEKRKQETQEEMIKAQNRSGFNLWIQNILDFVSLWLNN